jgi:hypothetical protein
MDKMIIIPINLFRLAQEILIVDETGTKTFAQVDLLTLPEVVVEASNVYGTNKIRLIGNSNYASALATEITEYAIVNYSNTNLDIDIVEA